MVKVIGPRDPTDPEAINTTSRSKTWSRGLSPFFLGPCQCYDGLSSYNMENAWQYAKVYSMHAGEDENPTSAYFTWRDYGWAKERADRYPNGPGAKPLYSWWAGRKLTYIEARRAIYIPLYKSAVEKTSAYRNLKSLYDSFGDITLWDFDGWDHRALGLSWEEVIDGTNRKMGHGFVLAMMLEGYI